MNMRLLAFATAVLAASAGFQIMAAEPASTAVTSGAVTETKWEELVPKDWDPTKRFRSSKLGMLSDTDPRVLQMMRELRETWDNAPTNNKMDGATVRLPGYVVPLDEVNGQMKEFLLVPYFGACIHTPPPPANQIVHVIADKPIKALRMMHAVWVTGTLKTMRLDTVMGTSGYRIQTSTIERYVAPGK